MSYDTKFSIAIIAVCTSFSPGLFAVTIDADGDGIDDAIDPEITVNFDDLDTSAGPVYGPEVDTYLANFGITITNVVATNPVRPSIWPDAIAQSSGNLVASSAPNYLQTPGGATVSHTLTFDKPLESFSFTRGGWCTTLSYPPRTATAWGAAGKILGSASEAGGSTLASC